MTSSLKAVKHWIQRGSFDYAEAELNALEPDVQNSVEGLHIQSVIAQQRGDWEKLETLGRRLQEIDPADSGGAFCIAESLHRRERHAEAIDILIPAKPLFKRPAEYFYSLARLHAAAGRLDQALQLIEQAEALAPAAKDKALLDPAFQPIHLQLIDQQ